MSRDTDATRRHFDALFATSADPWNYRQRWYEARKRALTLACLTRERYRSGFEPGCANGELSAALALRCDRLLICDGTPRAVDLARQRVAGFAHVHAIEAWMPGDWPDGRFDLIVLSEIAYYLAPPALETFLERARAALLPGGDLVACHWRGPLDDGVMNAIDLHRFMAERLGLPRLVSVDDPDFCLDVFSDDARSVARREG